MEMRQQPSSGAAWPISYVQRAWSGRTVQFPVAPLAYWDPAAPVRDGLWTEVHYQLYAKIKAYVDRQVEAHDHLPCLGFPDYPLCRLVRFRKRRYFVRIE